VKHFLLEAAGRLGFQKVGFAEPTRLEGESDHLAVWLEENRHGTMDWLARRRAERTDPARFYPAVKTVVSLAMNYCAPPPGLPKDAPRWSSYAWGDDYHLLLRQRMKALLAEVIEAYPGTGGIACVDTSPVMEKVWAQRAGLGWQGKHTNLITRDYGSWVFLGELLLDVVLEPDPPFEEDLCGSCTALPGNMSHRCPGRSLPD
jgi:epoxyqueuosine reductase